MSERLINDIVSTLRTEYPGIVEEWERQRTESPDWDFPIIDTPSGLWWWLDSERYITQEFAGGTAKDDETERRLGEFCVRAMEQLRTAPTEEEPTASIDERDEQLQALSTRIVNALADLWAYPLDHAELVNGADEVVLSMLRRSSELDDENTNSRITSPDQSAQSLDEHGNWRAGTWDVEL